MFGYVRINKNNMKIADWQTYRRYYCLLCKNMGCYSQLSRFFLSYDMVFFTIISGTPLPMDCVHNKRTNCISCKSSSELDYWACLSILLIYYKLENDVEDGAWYKKPLLIMFRKAKRQCESILPVQSETISNALKEIASLENDNCDDIDQLSNIFAEMMATVTSASPSNCDSDIERITSCIAYWLSRWIYIIDALDDMKKDRKKGDFNPFILLEETLNRSDVIAKARNLLEECLERLEHYCLLYPYTDQYAILCNVLAEGVPITTASILNRNEDKE